MRGSFLRYSIRMQSIAKRNIADFGHVQQRTKACYHKKTVFYDIRTKLPAYEIKHRYCAYGMVFAVLDSFLII